MDQEFNEFVSGINRVLMERHGCKMVLLIQSAIGMDQLTNMADPVERMGFLKAAMISTEEEFKEKMRLCVATSDAEEHLAKTAQAFSGRGGGGKAN